MSPRRYEQRARAEAAEETRRRILDAVYRRLREAPAQPLSVDAVAADAGVARSTVYVIFGSRAGLFEAFADYFFARAEIARLSAAFDLPGARDVMRAATRASCEFYAAERDVSAAIYSTALLDPEATGGLTRQLEDRRVRSMRLAVRRLRDEGELRPELSMKAAVDMWFVTASFDAFDQLYTGRGLSAARTADLLVEMTERLLCV